MTWRPRFSLRTLVIFTLLCTSGVGLWWHWEPWYKEQALSVPGGRIYDAAWSPDGSQIITGGNTAHATLWDANSGSMLRRFQWPSADIVMVRFSSDGLQVVALGHFRKTKAEGDASPRSEWYEIRVWPSAGGAPVKSFTWDEVLNPVTATRNGRFFSGSANNAHYPFATILDVKNERQHFHSRSIRDVLALSALSDDGRSLAIEESDKILLWDLDKDQEPRELDAANCVFPLGFSRDGRRLAHGALHGDVRWVAIRDVETGLEVRRIRLPVGKDRVAGFSVVDFSSDGNFVAVGSNDPSIHILNIPMGRHVYAMADWASGMSFSRSGQRLLLAGSPEGTARIWRKRRPEWWWGVFYLWEFWLTVAFAGLFVWSVVSDRRVLGRGREEIEQ